MLTIFETDSLRVEKAAEFASRQMLVTFMERRGDAQGLGAPGFGRDFARKRGLDGFYVKCAGNDWYQYPEMPQAIEAIRNHCSPEKEIVTYGSSMGAYAALKFAKSLDATRVVALSPLYSPNPLKRPYEKRWNSDARRIKFIDDDLAGNGSENVEVFIVTDTAHADAKHARLIASAFPQATILAAPMASHPVGHFLREAEILTNVISMLIDGKLDIAAWRRICRSSRTKSKIYMERLRSSSHALTTNNDFDHASADSKSIQRLGFWNSPDDGSRTLRGAFDSRSQPE